MEKQTKENVDQTILHPMKLYFSSMLFNWTMTQHFWRPCLLIFLLGVLALFLFLAKIQDQEMRVKINIFTILELKLLKLLPYEWLISYD